VAPVYPVIPGLRYKVLMRLKNEPKQQRSRETLAIILQATVQVIQDSDDGSFSLRAVAERAGISQGTLYARFPTREELLEYVHHDYWERNVKAVETFAAENAIAPDVTLDRPGLEALVKKAIAFYADHMREGRPVLQALTRAMEHAPRLVTLQRDKNLEQLERVLGVAERILGARWTPAVKSRLETAIRLAVGMVRDATVLGPADPAVMRLTTDDLVQHLTPIALGLIDPA